MEEVLQVASMGVEQGCAEILFTLGGASYYHPKLSHLKQCFFLADLYHARWLCGLAEKTFERCLCL